MEGAALLSQPNRKVELTAAVSLAATTGGLFFLADEGQDEGAAVRRGAVLEQSPRQN
jgi:hypothetical protein